MSDGWPLRMGKYEFDGYRHGKASFRKPGTKDWNLIVWHPEGRWELAPIPELPIFVTTRAPHRAIAIQRQAVVKAACDR